MKINEIMKCEAQCVAEVEYPTSEDESINSENINDAISYIVKNEGNYGCNPHSP